MSVEQNKTLVHRFFAEICNGRNLAVADELFSADHRHHDPFIPDVAPGPEGQKQLLSTYHIAFPNAEWVVEEVLAAEGDRVVTRWVGQGTNTGELSGMPPTGKPVSVPGIWIHHIADGKIVESWNVWDAVGMLRQLGVVPAA